MEKVNLAELVEKAQKGDPTAVEELFSACYDDVYYFALKTVKDPDLACDITQESFLEVINTLHNLQQPGAFKAWLRQITYHQCTRYFKQTKEVQVEEDEEGNSIFDTLADEREGAVPAEVYEKEEFRQTILQMVDSLSAEQRAAVMLYYFDELSVEEVAKVQGVSTGTVKSRLSYARKALKKSVEDYEKKNNIKLHSLAPLPLLLLVLRGAAQKMPATAAENARTAICTAAELSGSAGSKAATAIKAGATAQKAVAIKATAGVVAAALVATGVVMAFDGVKPGAYASENMVIYGQTDQLAEKGIEILGPTAEYLVSPDGVCYAISYEDAPLEVGQAEDTVYLAGDVGFGDGKDFTAPDGEKFTDIRGQVQAIIRPISQELYALSVDENGVWGSCIEDETGAIKCVNLPLQVSGIEQPIRGIEVVPGILDRCGVITDTGFYYGSLDAIHCAENAVVLTISNGAFVEGRVMDYAYGVNSYLPMYISCADGQLYWCEQVIAMPEGYNTDQLVQALCGAVMVLRFDDGSVYTLVDGQMVRHQQLSELGQKGHLKKVFLTGYSFHGKVLVLMDDYVLYTVEDTEK